MTNNSQPSVLQLHPSSNVGIVVGLGSTTGQTLYLVVDDPTPDRIHQVEIVVSAVSRRLAEIGRCTLENFRAELAMLGIVTGQGITLQRAWDAFPGSLDDTWQVRVPLEAPHSLRGRFLTADPLPDQEHIAVGLRCTVTNQIYLPLDRPYVHDEHERTEMLERDTANEAIFEQVPLGALELSLSQFAGIQAAQTRAMNLLTEAGYTYVLVA